MKKIKGWAGRIKLGEERKGGRFKVLVKKEIL